MKEKSVETVTLMNDDGDYRSWIIDIKNRVYKSQIKAAISVNSELIQLYWSLGKDIAQKQLETKYGSNFLSN